MKYYILFGDRFLSREEAYAYLARVFDFPSSFGANLDALWDVLTDIKDCEIEINNAREIPRLMGDYGLKMLDLFGDLAKEGYMNVTINW